MMPPNPPGPVCYHFKAINVQPANDTIISAALPEGLGWTYQFDSSGAFAETLLVTICTSDISPIGSSGGVALTFVYGTTFKSINFAVRQAWNNGDLCGGPAGEVDCVVDVFDVIYLIDYSFAGGPPPPDCGAGPMASRQSGQNDGFDEPSLPPRYDFGPK